MGSGVLNLVDVDKDGIIDEDDWQKALVHSATELTRKDFSDLYDFNSNGTLRETVINVLALVGRPLSKQELRDYADGKNIYGGTCLGELKKTGAVKELPNGTLILHSMLFRAAVLIHIYTHATQNPTYKGLIKKLADEGEHKDNLLKNPKSE